MTFAARDLIHDFLAAGPRRRSARSPGSPAPVHFTSTWPTGSSSSQAIRYVPRPEDCSPKRFQWNCERPGEGMLLSSASRFVLTHHPRASITMQGGTTFHFVDGGIKVALERAFDAANGADVMVGGGAATVQQYLRAGLLDEMHLAIVPILLGSGERLFDHLDGGPDGYECVEFVSSPSVTHVRLSRAPR